VDEVPAEVAEDVIPSSLLALNETRTGWRLRGEALLHLLTDLRTFPRQTIDAGTIDL
jgi:hypothetical protein